MAIESLRKSFLRSISSELGKKLCPILILKQHLTEFETSVPWNISKATLNCLYQQDYKITYPIIQQIPCLLVKFYAQSIDVNQISSCAICKRRLGVYDVKTAIFGKSITAPFDDRFKAPGLVFCLSCVEDFSAKYINKLQEPKLKPYIQWFPSKIRTKQGIPKHWLPIMKNLAYALKLRDQRRVLANMRKTLNNNLFLKL